MGVERPIYDRELAGTRYELAGQHGGKDAEERSESVNRPISGRPRRQGFATVLCETGKCQCFRRTSRYAGGFGEGPTHAEALQIPLISTENAKRSEPAQHFSAHFLHFLAQ